MNPAPNMFLVGPTGAGKTTIGRRLAELLHLPFVDLDQVIEQRCGVSVALIFELEGEPGFRRRESALLAELADADGIVLATGGGAVLDPDNRRRLRERGFVVWLQADVAQQLARLERDRKRPLLAAPDRAERLARMAAQRNPLYAEVADLAVHPHSDAVLSAARELATQVQQRWRRSGSGAASAPCAGVAVLS